MVEFLKPRPSATFFEAGEAKVKQSSIDLGAVANAVREIIRSV